MRKLLAIGFIWLGCAIAWMVLGSSVVHRTGESSSTMANGVSSLWGPALVQAPPTALVLADSTPTAAQVASPQQPVGSQPSSSARERVVVAGVPQPLTGPTPFELDASDIDVSLELEHRRKGLMWFATYGVSFSGRFAFENDDAEPP